MDRTESIIVQVAPAYENDKIKEMEAFGWNLHGRQEIHEQGDAYGRPSYIDRNEYIIKMTVHNYVKLHFVRDTGLPDLDKIKTLEVQYFNVPFPEFPKLVPGGWLLLLFWYPAWPIWYFRRYKSKKAIAETQLAEALRKRSEIVSKVAKLF